ncbi:MAG: hypothetical protein L0J48_04565, partial [Alkalibacterium sp.]|nr:hypothetical protein [Alkalibacterium sp.]
LSEAPDDDPDLLKIREPFEKQEVINKVERPLPRTMIDFRKIKLMMELASHKKSEIMKWLCISRSSLDYRLETSSFTRTHIAILEAKFNLKKGALLK